MRHTAERELIQFAKFSFIKASAEHTTLPGYIVDFITVAQAFHWFDRANFRLECQRILKDSGKVILVWNCRDSSSELVNENNKINQKHCEDYNGFSGGTGGKNPECYADFFKGGICEYRCFQNDLYFDEESFIGRNLSASYAPKEGTKAYRIYIDELKQLFLKYSINGELCLPSVTKSYVGEV